MRFLIRLVVVLLLLGGVFAVARKPLTEKWKQRNRVEFKEEAVTRGSVIRYVNATGKIKPVESILIGSFVSGPISDMPEGIDFNKEIQKDDLMARVDPLIYKAQVDSATANLAIREAEVKRARAQLQQAKNDENRAIRLREKREGFVADSEMDRLRFAREQFDAQLEIAKASVLQATANLSNAQANLDYTFIRAPKDGIIIDRKIEPGQTLAAQFQTPELFEIGVGMRKEMHIYASVDENDIGLIRQAQQRQKEDDVKLVTFTVNAYRDELFEGSIEQIRMSATETQAVVTYPVVVSAENPELKLLPGMTADLSFRIEQRDDVLRVPNQALTFFPEKKYVHEEDHKILDGSAWGRTSDEDADESDEEVSDISASKRSDIRKSRHKRHIWVRDGEKLRAVEVETGLPDQEEGRVTEVRTGALKEDQKVVVGVKKRKNSLFGG